MRLTLLIGWLLLISQASHAQKSDTLSLANGDRVTCEIKSLKLGKLSVKTSDLGTVSIKWLKIGFVESKQELEITLRDHRRFYGTFVKSDSLGYALIQYGDNQELQPLTEIVSITQIGRRFWQGIDGKISYGFSFASGTQNLQSTFNANASYKQRLYKHEIKLNSIISKTDGNESQNQNATYFINRYIMNRGFVALQVGWQQNSELGIDSRIISGVTYGYEPLANNANALTFSAGVVYNREYTNENQINNSVEGIIMAVYNVYLLYKPKISLAIDAIAYPSFSDAGRIRSDVNMSLSYEIFNDFTLTGSYYNNFDSKPASEEALKEDWGFTATIGYTF